MNEITARVPLAIGFDLGGTLLEYHGLPGDWSGVYPGMLAAVARACQIELTAERRAMGVAVLERYNTRRSPREIEVGAPRIMNELLATWGVGRSALDPVEALFAPVRSDVRPFSEVPGVLAALRVRGVDIGVLTDVPYGMPRAFVLEDIDRAALPIPRSHVITSGCIGRRKPAYNGFRALARRLDARDGPRWFVGDESKDMDGAAGAGWTPILIWRDSAPAPVWGQVATITTLRELVAALERSSDLGVPQ